MKVGTDGVLLGAWAENPLAGVKDRTLHLLDVGTGTGLIALMLAQRYPNAHVDALEMDSLACQQARENVTRSPFSSRIRVIEGRFQDYYTKSFASDVDLPSHTFSYELIVSNPPFFTNTLKSPDIQRRLARNTDTLSFRDLFSGVQRLLAPEGVFCAVIPVEEADPFLAEGCFAGLLLIRRCSVSTVEGKAPCRLLLSFARHRTFPFVEEQEVMMTRKGGRTAWCQSLTGEFYL